MTLSEKMTACMEQSIRNHEAAGYNLLILKDGKELCYAEAGMASLEKKTPVRRDSIFRLYSQSKPITATAVMILVERGLIDLMDGVDRYLPGFANPTVINGDGSVVPANRAPWIVEMLGMTAGTVYPDVDPAGQKAAALFAEQEQRILNGNAWDTVTFMNKLGELPLAFQPGSHWRYGTCADVLGAVVEVVTGKTLGQFMKEEIFEPLGMKDTAFMVPEEKMDRFVSSYRRVDGGLELFERQHLAVGRYGIEPAFQSGGAGLVSTLDDYAAFATMLLNGGIYQGKRILAEKTVQFMTRPQLNDRIRYDMWDSLDGYSYGRLMRVGVEPGRMALLGTEGEYGWDGWLGTYFCNIPDQRITFLMFQNTTDTGTSSATRKCRNILSSSL